ncbi:hypothetical protein, partial [Halomonas lysinitropha]|uniref:hypothetical protein n=1 Tax=Halomonas lysinitropha TaxID=2607506 RepID=UPI001788AA01
ILLKASATITDGDEDSASDDETVDISDSFSFDDDVPTVTVTEDTTFDAPSLTTQDADTIGEDDPATTE